MGAGDADHVAGALRRRRFYQRECVSMVRFLTTLVVAATTVTVQADRTTHSSANPVVRRTRASLDGRVPSAISVGVFAPPDVTESLLIRVFDEANAIWEPTDIALDWQRITAKDVAAAWQVTVTIDDERKGLAERHGALGWILFTSDGPAPSIRLSRANAEALIRRTPGVTVATIVDHEILIGRALGRALSHEIGHYLLKSKVHTPHGLMRAIWPSDELFSHDRRGFELTAEQRAAAEHLPINAPRQDHIASMLSCDGVKANGAHSVHLNDRLAFGGDEMRRAGRDDHEGSGGDRSQTGCVERIADPEGPGSLENRDVFVRLVGVRLKLKMRRQPYAVREGDCFGGFAIEHHARIARRIARNGGPREVGGCHHANRTLVLASDDNRTAEHQER